MRKASCFVFILVFCIMMLTACQNTSFETPITLPKEQTTSSSNKQTTQAIATSTQQIQTVSSTTTSTNTTAVPIPSESTIDLEPKVENVYDKNPIATLSDYYLIEIPSHFVPIGYTHQLKTDYALAGLNNQQVISSQIDLFSVKFLITQEDIESMKNRISKQYLQETKDVSLLVDSLNGNTGLHISSMDVLYLFRYVKSIYTYHNQDSTIQSSTLLYAVITKEKDSYYLYLANY